MKYFSFREKANSTMQIPNFSFKKLFNKTEYLKQTFLLSQNKLEILIKSNEYENENFSLYLLEP